MRRGERTVTRQVRRQTGEDEEKALRLFHREDTEDFLCANPHTLHLHVLACVRSVRCGSSMWISY